MADAYISLIISLISDASTRWATDHPSAYLEQQQQHNMDPNYDAYSHVNKVPSNSVQSTFAFRPPQPRFSAPALPVRVLPDPVPTSHITGGSASAHSVQPDIARYGAAGQLGTHLRSTTELRGYNSPLSSPQKLNTPSRRISPFISIPCLQRCAKPMPRCRFTL